MTGGSSATTVVLGRVGSFGSACVGEEVSVTTVSVAGRVVPVVEVGSVPDGAVVEVLDGVVAVATGFASSSAGGPVTEASVRVDGSVVVPGVDVAVVVERVGDETSGDVPMVLGTAAGEGSVTTEPPFPPHAATSIPATVTAPANHPTNRVPARAWLVPGSFLPSGILASLQLSLGADRIGSIIGPKRITWTSALCRTSAAPVGSCPFRRGRRPLRLRRDPYRVLPMQPVLTSEQSRRQDGLADADPRILLDRAGLAVALQAAAMGAGYGRRVAVLAGPGNNGGDGYVAARYLAGRGAAVDVYPLTDPRTEPARWACRLAEREGVTIRAWNDPRPADLVIDALFGAGFRGALPDLAVWDEVAACLAVDVPSGLDAGTGRCSDGLLVAGATVTFHGYRVGHLVGTGPDVCGEVTVADIGLPDVAPEMWLCGEEDAPLPVRNRTGHKWSAGSVLVVGGSGGLDGAATLTARAALRAGAGAVMIACPPTVEEKVRSPEIMTRAIGVDRSFTEADLPQVVDLAGRFDVVVIGPGLGSAGEMSGFVIRFLQLSKGPLVVDADALNALSGPADLVRAGDTVITPHTGEFARLTGRRASYPEAIRLADRIGGTVLLKGAPTFVMGEQRWVVNSGGPELSTIGSGDVLAGMIGAFSAAGLAIPAAARSAAYWHGRAAADLQRIRTVTADLLVDHLGVTTRR